MRHPFFGAVYNINPFDALMVERTILEIEKAPFAQTHPFTTILYVMNRSIGTMLTFIIMHSTLSYPLA